MKLKYLLAASVVSLAATTTFVAPAAAQQITSGVEGQVTDENGEAIAGAVVTVTNTANNATRTTTTGSDGGFRIIALQPGSYSITVTAAGYEGQTVERFSAITGRPAAFSFSLASTAAGGADNTIIVTGARARVSQVAVGPGSAFGAEELESFPSITRDIRDIIRIDPRVALDNQNDVERISCLGGNDRSNTFTVDGIVQADAFGLNGTPFAARNALPLPFDVVDQVSVEFAPFDVEYSEFTGCLVNVVTKGGGNEFHGSAFITYFDGGMVGDLDTGSQEKRWGATLSGPIIKDRLFFSFGYEETDLGDGNEFGPAGGGFLNEANFVTQAQFDEFSQIARDVYGQDTGGYPRALPEASVRYFGRLDAVIAEGHRLEATYQRLEETNVESDSGASNLTGLNSFEDEGTISDYYSVRLYSEWNESISTELRLSRAEVGDVQGPVGGGEAQSANPITRLVVGVQQPGQDGILGTPDDINGNLSTGPGIFRSANQLDTKIDQARFQMNIDAGGGHFFKIGAELNDLQVFNLFAINATGSLYFSNLDDFRNGLLSPGDEDGPNNDEIASGAAIAGDINATPSGDINEAAALFSRQIWSFYAQDEWQATDQLSINAGIRVQLYDGDAPRANPQFLDRYGFSNANPFSRLDPVILPRISATYEFDNDGFFSNSRLTGGVGVFSGGDPVVYFSNAFSNNGFSTGLGTSNDCAPGQIPIDPVSGRPTVLNAAGGFTGFPSCITAAGSALAAGGLADTQSTDPEFDVPTVVRANIGFATNIGTETGFFSNWKLNLDYIYSRFNDTLNFVDLSQTPNITRGLNGFTVDGRPIYASIDPNDPDAVGCNATLDYSGGTPPVWQNVTAACFNRIGRDDEIQLTNGPSYDSHVASIILSKRFQGGLFTQGGSFNVNLGYAWTDSNNNRNNGSSTATSSYDITAAFDRQNPAVSTSNFEVRHNITATFNLREEFIDGYDTNIGLFFRARSGLPYSLTFDGGGVFNDGASGSDNALLYIPSGPSDPNVSPSSNAQAVADLIDYVNGTNCGFTPGQSIERNTCRQDWHFDVDLRFSQELPFIGKLTGITQDRVTLFADFQNFLNLLDNDWNVLRRRPEFVDVVDGGVDPQGRYIITGFAPDDQNFIAPGPSAWRIQVGARYEF
ncbi:TonB-dependent receptor [Erythrobacter dokdonensis]|uniref:Oar-like outer membrane protein, OmpA family protein n=1 Tax=Erythrobacter dokdonensis DSW-74 TaxID=1300349 RepID=A0A1A7BCQ4_9SPHN|nr:TonB-dependent receptor [Erythrobacter dokdonensis]OBV10274.1 Oar-like outer membrane protein, OmpA family protein [Erythrobacter dokdonensis DSW-74]